MPSSPFQHLTQHVFPCFYRQATRAKSPCVFYDKLRSDVRLTGDGCRPSVTKTVCLSPLKKNIGWKFLLRKVKMKCSPLWNYSELRWSEGESEHFVCGSTVAVWQPVHSGCGSDVAVWVPVYSGCGSDVAVWEPVYSGWHCVVAV